MASNQRIYEVFRAALATRDLEVPGDLVADGQWHCCDVISKGRGGRNDGSYKLCLDGPAPFGLFRNWTDGEDVEFWRGDRTRALTDAEREELERRLEEAWIEAERIAAEEAEQTAQEAKEQWAHAKEAPADHPYLRRKRVKPHGARVDKLGRLLVPISNPGRGLVNLQLIDADGRKSFLRGGRTSGCAFEIEGNTDAVVVTEGFATGASINEAAGYSVIVAFNAGNLANVAKVVRRNLSATNAFLWQPHKQSAAEVGLRHEKRRDFVDTELIIAADDDWRTKNNPGLMKGLAAAREAKALIAAPCFDKPRPDHATDFNDLAKVHGLDAVKEDIEKAVEPQVLFEKHLLADPHSAHGDAIVKELAAWSQLDKVFYEDLLARLKRKGVRIRELERAVKNSIEEDAAKVAAAARRKRRVKDEVDVEALAKSAAAIVECDDVLEMFAEECSRFIAGEESLIKLLYLSGTSRLFPKAMHVAIKGPSAGGKSEARKHVLEYFPPESVFSFTALSERALLYVREDFQHKILSMGEAYNQEEVKFQDYLLRELMSEGVLRYQVPRKQPDGTMETVTIEKHGPVAFMVTTTRNKLHPENETRMLSIEVDDSAEQTRRVVEMVAEVEGFNRDVVRPKLKLWHDYQRWLAEGECRVNVPFAPTLVSLITQTKSVRLRRDVGQLLRAIKAHALLHRAHRRRTKEGEIVAEIERDYKPVRLLVGDPLATAAEMKTRKTVKETVEAVKQLEDAMHPRTRRLHERAGTPGIAVKEIAARLNLDMSAVYRRLQAAEMAGFLVNLEDRPRRPGRYKTTGDKQDGALFLPKTVDLQRAFDDARKNSRSYPLKNRANAQSRRAKD
jgi:phage/plasmid primase-like uncharacterized protein